MPEPSKLAPAPPNDEMRYRAQDAMHTIARAEEHKRDRDLMRHVRSLAGEVHRAVGAAPGKASKLGAAKKRGGNQPLRMPDLTDFAKTVAAALRTLADEQDALAATAGEWAEQYVREAKRYRDAAALHDDAAVAMERPEG